MAAAAAEIFCNNCGTATVEDEYIGGASKRILDYERKCENKLDEKKAEAENRKFNRDLDDDDEGAPSPSAASVDATAPVVPSALCAPADADVPSPRASASAFPANGVLAAMMQWLRRAWFHRCAKCHAQSVAARPSTRQCTSCHGMRHMVLRCALEQVAWFLSLIHI